MAWGHAAATAIDHTTTATTNAKMLGFIPEVWSGRILKALDDKLIMGKLVNRDYEGVIKGAGDTVRVHMVGNVTAKPYVIPATRATTPTLRQTEITYQTLDGASTTLQVDTADYFAFEVEDIEEAMANPKYIAEASSRAGVALAQRTERYILGRMIAAAQSATADDFGQVGGTSNYTSDIFGGASINVGAETSSFQTAYNKLVDLGIDFDDALAPEDGRWIVAPSFVLANLLKDERFVGAGADGAGQMRDKGKIGSIAGFDVYTLSRRTFADYDAGNMNTQVPNDTGTDDASTYGSPEMWTGASSADLYTGMAGVKDAFTFVDAINKTETVRLQGSFANGVRGLHVYGGKALRPQWLFAVQWTDNKGLATGGTPTVNPES